MHVVFSSLSTRTVGSVLRRCLSSTYGVQGDSYANPEKGLVAGKSPVRVSVLKDKHFFWCSCGRSSKQPYCDGSHKKAETTLQPVKYIPEESKDVTLCMCKQTNNRPFCDGSHSKL